MDLQALRSEIDQIDGELLDLFLRRMEISGQVAAYKIERGLPVLHPGREEEIIRAVRGRAGKLAGPAQALYETILSESRGLQEALIADAGGRKPETPPQVNHGALVIDCAPGTADELALFYSGLLGWRQTHSAPGWAAVTAPDGKRVIAFQEWADYRPPVWPYREGAQGQMMHLDLMVEDLEAGVAHALACGAKLAEEQYFQTSRTMLDPAGHPFCIDTNAPEPE